jgi:hypothetical protein
MNHSSVLQKLPRGKKEPLKRRVTSRYQDVVASVSLVAASATVLALVLESMMP